MRSELTDGNVRIRRYTSEDVDRHYEAAVESIASVYPWLPWCHPEYDRSEAEEWIIARPAAWDTGTDYAFAIEDARTGVYSGGCGLNCLNMQHRSANLGYWVRTSMQGKGFASGAARLLGRFGLEDLGLARMEIIASVKNEPSRRAAEKSGAVYEGVLHNRLVIHGATHDAHCFCFVPPDHKDLQVSASNSSPP